ncbi:MAG: hypothetical protein HC921_12545 [Synechococcaceae cyanobacterium SM2_3_1]|nr:hypothetical protein [Synechococcaceae cyanobacterium SM2_3_1]
MTSWLKRGLLAAAVSVILAPAANAMDPALMNLSPSDPLFDEVILMELQRLNQEIQLLSTMAMESGDEEVKAEASAMFDAAMEMEAMLSQLRTRTMGAEANSRR